MDKQIHLTLDILPSLLIPVISAGVLLTGAIMFIYVILHVRAKLYKSLLVMTALAFLFVIAEFHIILIGSLLQDFSSAVQFQRIEQLIGMYFAAALPHFIRHLLKTEGRDILILKGLTFAAIGVSIFVTFAAFLAPDSFISVTQRILNWQDFAGDWGRGKTGPLYNVRDGMLALSVLVSLFFLAGETFRHQNKRMLLSILIGLLIGIFFAADDIVHIYTRQHIGFFPQVPYPRFPVGITILVSISVLAVLHRFLDQTEDIQKAYAALHNSEERFKEIAENINEVFWLQEYPSGKLLYVKKAYDIIWGRKKEDLYESLKPWKESIVPEDWKQTVKPVLEHPEQAAANFEYRITLADGSVRWIQEKMSSVAASDGEIYRLARISEDITEKKEAMEELKLFAYHDILTGLLNRKSFYEIFEKVLSQGKRERNIGLRAIFFIDLDHFKDVNDSLGHNTGDILLTQVAKRIGKVTRKSDYVFRIGGDEFTVLGTLMTEETDAAIIAEKILKTLSEPFTIGEHQISLGASVGIALFPRDGEDIHSLIRKADSALYEAKRDRNAYRFYTKEMQDNAVQRLRLISELREAMHLGELDLYFQPQNNWEGKIIGSEALLRWNSGKLGNIPPATFIPLAEETGLILPIGNWVIEKACEYIVDWRKEGHPVIPVSINISPKQLKEEDLVPRLKECMGDYNVSMDELHLEITESSFMEDPTQTLQRITRLAEEGFTISIDDFGTGYSSLSYLKNLPVKTVKIDRSFVIGVPHNERDVSLLKAIIHMILGLQLRVLAEGVDSEDQRRFLLEHNCGVIQGYYFSKPLPSREFLAYARENLERF